MFEASRSALSNCDATADACSAIRALRGAIVGFAPIGNSLTFLLTVDGLCCESAETTPVPATAARNTKSAVLVSVNMAYKLSLDATFRLSAAYPKSSC